MVHYSMILIKAVLIVVLTCCLMVPVLSQTTDAAKAFETAEGLVSDIYKSVSFEAGSPPPDWEKVRSMFLPNAVVVLRVARDSMAIFSVQGFIDDFVNFIERSPAKKNGFKETIIRMKPMLMGNIAQILVLYEAMIPGTMRPPQQGVDSWELVKRDGRWWIVSVTNEVVNKNTPVPTTLQE